MRAVYGVVATELQVSVMVLNGSRVEGRKVFVLLFLARGNTFGMSTVRAVLQCGVGPITRIDESGGFIGRQKVEWDEREL